VDVHAHVHSYHEYKLTTVVQVQVRKVASSCASWWGRVCLHPERARLPGLGARHREALILDRLYAHAAPSAPCIRPQQQALPSCRRACRVTQRATEHTLARRWHQPLARRRHPARRSPVAVRRRAERGVAEANRLGLTQSGAAAYYARLSRVAACRGGECGGQRRGDDTAAQHGATYLGMASIAIVNTTCSHGMCRATRCDSPRSRP
jgi:hypothetical protein